MQIDSVVRPGHSRSKNGVAALAYVAGIHVLKNQILQNQVLQNQVLQNQVLQNQILQNQKHGWPKQVRP
jgi:hypothetical protein